MYSQFRPTIITGEWRSGNAVAQLGPSTKMAISAGNGWLNRSRILPVKSELSYRHLRQRFVASRCRSAEVLRKDGGDKPWRGFSCRGSRLPRRSEGRRLGVGCNCPARDTPIRLRSGQAVPPQQALVFIRLPAGAACEGGCPFVVSSKNKNPAVRFRRGFELK